MEAQNDILKELNTVAPELARLKGKASHDVPADYFSSFSGFMLQKVRQEELKKIAPVFSELEKTNGMEAPANYFKEFPALMLKKVKKESKEEITPSSIWFKALTAWTDKIAAFIFKPKYAYAFAVIVTMLVTGSMFLLQVGQTTCPSHDLVCQLEKVSDEELDAYMYSNADEFHKSVLDISTDDQKIEKRADDIDKELNNLLKGLDEETINSI